MHEWRKGLLTLRAKLMLITFGIILLSLVSTATIAYTASYYTIKDETIKQMNLAIRQTILRVDDKLKGFFTVALTMAYDYRTQDAIAQTGRSNTVENSIRVNQLLSYLRTCIGSYKDIENILIYDTVSNKRFTQFGYRDITTTSIYDNKVRTAIFNENYGEAVYIIWEGSETGQKRIGIVMPILNGQRDRLGAVVLIIREDVFKILYESEIYPDLGMFLLTDEQGKTISSSGISESQKIAIADLAGSGSNSVMLDGQEFLETIYMSSLNRWRYYALFPIDRLMVGITKGLILTLLIELSLGAVLLVLLALLLGYSFYKPLTDMLGRIEQAILNNSPLERIHRTDEIGMIYNRVGEMLILNDELRKINYDKEMEAKEWELRSLRYQINPHFLYNTLADVVYLIQMKSIKNAETMLRALISLYRVNFNSENKVIPLKDEIENLKNYMQIQKLRFADKIVFQLEIRPEINDKLILQLVLQPIVENAIYHGIMPKENGGTILIRAFALGEALITEIYDDGVGMSEDKIACLLSDSDDTAEKMEIFSALRNINKRLQLFYGDKCSLQITSKESAGTCVTLSVPSYTPYRGGHDAAEN
ncbi:MAG: hypothetical protein F9K48_02580 [Candidatus Brocadia sp.]|nr:MAG: hypothetical protein F9K48_02580 [Candidatus Brocadia sp.]